MTSSTKLSLNVIPLQLEETQRRFGFYKTRPENREAWPLTPAEMPVNLSDMYTEGLYTDFTDRDADLGVTVDFELSPKFAKHYMNYQIYRWFEGKARLRKRNFVRNNEFYFLEKKDKANNLAVFDRFAVRATYKRMTDGFELTLMYSGAMTVWLKPVIEYSGPSTDFRTVIYAGEVYKYEDLMEQKGINREEVYPVVNRAISRELDLPRPEWKKINKMKRHTAKIDWFYKTHVDRAAFREEFKPSEFMSLPAEATHRIDGTSANLQFGNGRVDKNPYVGMKLGGPYEPPRVSHVELFMIVAEEDAEPIGNDFFKKLRDGTGHFPGLKKFAQLPIRKEANHITFKNKDNPLPEIRQKLQAMTLERNVHYGAIYISPIHRDDPDPAKRNVYYRMKEELLKYSITSQVVDVDSIKDPNFAYYLPNIAVALTAKMDGVPWTLEKKAKSELVIGVGAYRPNERRKKYLGSAFCFSNSGDFQGFNSFMADDHLKLAGSFQKKIKEFKEQNNRVERVVIHFYKKMNRKEAGMVKRALKELKLDVPVVILTIHKTQSSDLVLVDRSKHHRLPLSGTWMKSGRSQFLLCNNTRFDEPKENIKSYPYPIKVYVDLATEAAANGDWNKHNEQLNEQLEDADWLEELLEQVYQFSRLNWQTVSIKSLPVTVSYPEMVARKFPFFDGDVIPEFGKRNFWFL